MPEVRSFESSNATQNPPTFERNFVSPEKVDFVRANVQAARSLHARNTAEERKEAEDYLAQMDFALMDVTSGVTVAARKESPVVMATPEKVPVSKPPESSQDRKKIAAYGNLADLAYVDFVQNSGNLETAGAVLDPLSFPNIRNVENVPKKDLTENERELRKFLEKNPPKSFQGSLSSFDGAPVSRDASELLYIASGGRFDQSGIALKMAMRRGMSDPNADTARGIDRGIMTDGISPDYSPKYASVDPKYRSTMVDVEPESYIRQELNLPKQTEPLNMSLSEAEKLRVLQMNAGLEHVRQFKSKESSKLFESLQKEGYSVVDHFPDSDAKDSGSSGFSAIALKDKAGKTHIAVRGTELTDFGDIGADFKLMIGSVPENQTRDLIAFMDLNLAKLPPGEKVRIIGHSLGGALTQLASVMYDDRVEESYTFNSPGAKKLSVDPKSQPEEVRAKFEKYANFEYNASNASVENRIVNVAGSKGPTLIANLGNDVGFYKIELKGLQSHSITKLVKYVEKDAINEELRVQDVRKWDDRNNKTNLP